MEILKFIICISCFCCLFAEFSGLIPWLKFKQKEPWATWKPFDCAKCLSFWMGLIVFTLHGDGMVALFYASISSVLSIYIVRYAK